MSIWINKKTKKVHPTGKHWVKYGIVAALLLYQLVHAERERGRNLNELAIKYLWLYLFGHFHCAWYFTRYSLEMQHLHLKTKAQLLPGAFVCKHQVVVWNSVLSGQFEAICTGKDGLRWVTFSAEYVGQLISYYYISEKVEHIYHEKQQDYNEKDNGSKHKERECWIK